MNTKNSRDQKILDRSDGERRANDFINSGQVDPFPDVEPALLSADEIMKYVDKTGAISPFYCGGREKSRLKKASYEGRIGRHAYKYNDKGKLERVLGDKDLIVKANSIVFVECDLDFRLPNFIAMRFNLQIRHVHRGILLGTGPLVDPGFWGKLCIPLHNLTDEDYAIPRNEGLIWVELTKTSSSGKLGQKALYKEDKKFWDDIRDYINKAARQFDENKAEVPIRSSIPLVASSAEKSARKSEEKAEKFAKTVKKIQGYSIVAIAAFLVAVFVLFRGFYSNVTGIYNSLVPEIRKKIELVTEKTITNTEKMDATSKVMYDKINELVRENEKLRQENIEIRERVLHLEHLTDQ